MGSNEVDIKVIWKDLDAYEKELDKEAKSLQDIWTKICQLHAKTEDEIARFVWAFTLMPFQRFNVVSNSCCSSWKIEIM